MLTQLRESETRLQNSEEILRSSFESRQKRMSPTKAPTNTRGNLEIHDFNDNNIENDEDQYNDDDFHEQTSASNDSDINMSTLNSFIYQEHKEGHQSSLDDQDYSRSRSMVSSPEKSLNLISTSDYSTTSDHNLPSRRNLSFGD